MAYDLPGESRRLIHRIDGYTYTICAREVTFDHGKETDARPGKLIRGPQPAPAAG